MKNKEIKFTKRQIRALFRKVFKSAGKMSYYLYDDKAEKRTRTFIEDDALEYIMRTYTDRQFSGKGNNQKHYNSIFKNAKIIRGK